MKTADFDYDLPAALIAQRPAARREESRLLVVDRRSRRIEHRRFFELPEFLCAGDLLIRNTARVRPARLWARRPSGGQVECFLLRPAGAGGGTDARPRRSTCGRSGPTNAETHPTVLADGPPLSRGDPEGESGEEWWCLLRPGRKLPVGAGFGVEGEFAAQVREKSATAEYRVAFTPARAGESVATIAERLGRVPLPPYIHRSDTVSAAANKDDGALATEDRERYQTVFADCAHTVAVAAPTAGLHFTEALLAQLAGMGIEFADVVLHVGLGTFRPIETDEVAAHPIHRERVEVPATTAAKMRAPRAGRRIAVGTTSVRTVEHWARAMTRDLTAAESAPAGDAGYVGEADLFIHPPAAFQVVEGLITNFHLPRSTLLCLVASFLTPGSTEGVAWLREIYAEAIRERYRFLSYGDAMLIV
jgi:S-adenosylmethionine:tRNA ribosyltransferase-isomerase